MEKVPNFEIIVGTYEEFLLGYKIDPTKQLCLKQSFATHEHSSSLRTVTSSGKYIATGAADDRIHVYDMVIRKEHVMLTHHNSTVNCVEFTTGNTHLISSSIDGMLAITRVGNWVLEKMWEKSHKNGYVVALAVHPTGKLALTLGSDCTLQTWNLIKGRKAYIINLNSKSTDARSLSFIKWGLDGETFILGGGNNIEIWNIGTGGILKQFNYKTKVTSAAWLKESLIVIGHESGKLTVLNIETEVSKEYDAHSNRVKCLEYRNGFLATAASSGNIKLWSVKGKKLIELCECNSGCRITCLAFSEDLKVSKKEEETAENNNLDMEEMAKAKKLFEGKQKIIIEEGSDEEAEETVKKIELKLLTKNKKGKKRKNKTVPVVITPEVIEGEEINEPEGKKSKSKKKKRKSI